jgi:hypothetical protein
MTSTKMTELRRALEASWDDMTSYLGVMEDGNPSLGQCYPTSRVMQMFFPLLEIVEGEVRLGDKIDKHFWYVVEIDGELYHIDLTWQQFKPGSYVHTFKIRDSDTLNDSEETIYRCKLLKKRVSKYLGDN